MKPFLHTARYFMSPTRFRSHIGRSPGMEEHAEGSAESQ